MIEMTIAGFGTLKLDHLLLDYNGTIAIDGIIIKGVRDILNQLAEKVSIHVLTADTFGSVQRELAGTPCRVVVVSREKQTEAKREYVRKLGATRCVCYGNGAIDHLMLKEAALGIAVLQQEGASMKALLNADIVVTDIIDGLSLLTDPLRLTATLRS